MKKASRLMIYASRLEVKSGRIKISSMLKLSLYMEAKRVADKLIYLKVCAEDLSKIKKE